MAIQKHCEQNPITEIIHQHKKGKRTGIYSICSANQFVVEAAMRQSKEDNSPLLIESTSNQVNQFGGYTGMTPAQFVTYIKKIAMQQGFPSNRLILGGDHLGPNAWQNEKAASAMAKACAMIRDYVAAGFEKIHLDASMRCADDPGDRTTPMSDEVVAQRAAELCLAAEQTYQEQRANENTAPLYVIGTEVPMPGGTQEAEKIISVTKPEAVKRTIEITKEAFYHSGLQSAWERVIAVVVQPGVEFGDEMIFHYDSQKTKNLSQLIERYDKMVFEAHSTDYQTKQTLREMVRDHFAILKVGPALTFAFREAVFALEMMEIEWLSGKKGIILSGLRNVLETTMLEQPTYWQKHYHGDELYLKYARKYSYSDRSRYYWLHPDVNQALSRLFYNLTQTAIPPTLLAQFMPQQYQAIVQGEISNSPVNLIDHKIMEVTSAYAFACGNEK